MPFSRFEHRAPLFGGGVVVGAVALVSVHAAYGVARGRRAVEDNVAALSSLQRVEGSDERARDAFGPLVANPSAAVALATAEGLRQPSPARATGAVAAALRQENKAQSEVLARLVNRLIGSVAVLIAFGLAILYLLHQLRSSVLKVKRLIDQRLQSAEQDHAQNLAAVHALAATMAHEVNNPLTAMSLNLDLLAMGEAELSAPMRAAIEANRDGVNRIAAIVAELRALSGPRDTTRANLGAVVDTTLRLLDPRVRPLATVVCSLEERGPVAGDHVALGQVVTNLVLNAAEAFGERAREENRIVVASRAMEPDWVELTVSDNGPGFDPALLARLARPFVTTKPTGNGLGLYACKQIVERFGGKLKLEPLAQGARVAVWVRRPAQAQRMP